MKLFNASNYAAVVNICIMQCGSNKAALHVFSALEAGLGDDHRNLFIEIFYPNISITNSIRFLKKGQSEVVKEEFFLKLREIKLKKVVLLILELHG